MAIGKNNNMFENYFIKASAPSQVLDTDTAPTCKTTSEEIQSDAQETKSASQNEWINKRVQEYCEAPWKNSPGKTKKESFNSSYLLLKKVLCRLRKEYAYKQKRNKDIKVPLIQLDELEEYNLLKYQNQLAGIESPSIAGLIAAASSSNR